MILKNGIIVDDQFTLRCCDVQIDNDKIVGLGNDLTGDEIVDMTGKYILPGFIDTHIHGAYGVRISDEKPQVSKITQFLATQGVTSFAITTAASKFDNLLEQISLAADAVECCAGAKIVGIHAEGPFLSRKYKGAMNSEYIISPDIGKLDEMIECGRGLLKIVTIAPEVEGAEAFIRYAVSRGLTVSMGHTNADYEEAKRGIAAGVSRSTHTFNAMRPFSHREPGVVGAALTSPDVYCEVICDYVHLHPVTVNLIYMVKGAEHMVMISDSGHAAGLDVTEFVVDGLTRYVKDGVVRLADGTIAGSAKTLLDGVKNLIATGIPLEDIVRMASFNPAKSLKLEQQIGSIKIGKYADLVVLNEEYNVEHTFINGVCVYSK